jgi:hypothetical protein
MANTARISFKQDILCVESSDLLKKAKDSKNEKLLKVQPYQIRTEMNLVSAHLSVEQKTAAMKAAQKEADRIEDELVKKIKELASEVEKFLELDKRGNDKAGDLAEKRVKSVSDDIDDTLPDFGHSIRKKVQEAIKMKLASSVKSSSSGGFRGIKLALKFEHGGVSEEIGKDYQNAAKALDAAGEQAVTKSKEDKKATDALRQTLKDKIAEVEKAVKEVAKADDEAAKAKAAKANDDAAKTKDNEANKLKESFVSGIPSAARALGKEFKDYVDRIEGYQEHLIKTAKALKAEASELNKDLSELGPKAKAKKDRFEQVGRELGELQKVVDGRLKEAKNTVARFKAAESITQPNRWLAELENVSRAVDLAFVRTIDAEKFNKAAEAMVAEGKKQI